MTYNQLILKHPILVCSAVQMRGVALSIKRLCEGGLDTGNTLM